jgi:hypothetical protein
VFLLGREVGHRGLQPRMRRIAVALQRIRAAGAYGCLLPGAGRSSAASSSTSSQSFVSGGVKSRVTLVGNSRAAVDSAVPGFTHQPRASGPESVDRSVRMVRGVGRQTRIDDRSRARAAEAQSAPDPHPDLTIALTRGARLPSVRAEILHGSVCSLKFNCAPASSGACSHGVRFLSRQPCCYSARAAARSGGRAVASAERQGHS